MRVPLCPSRLLRLKEGHLTPKFNFFLLEMGGLEIGSCYIAWAGLELMSLLP
jgi:hypothetical protein